MGRMWRELAEGLLGDKKDNEEDRRILTVMFLHIKLMKNCCCDYIFYHEIESTKVLFAEHKHISGLNFRYFF